jgi:hypothetical protein
MSNEQQQEEKTGIKYIDELTPTERRLFEKRTQELILSLTPEQRVQSLDRFYTAIRKKIREKGGLITQDEAIRQIMNVDIPNQLEQTLKDISKNDPDVAARLRSNISGVDLFTSLTDQADKELAAIIKRWEPVDPTFENTIIPYNYGGNAKEFWEFYNSLKKKGFL